MSFVPATILTGFLGAGKTTLLKRILTEPHGGRIAVIENEFGEENIDAEILVAGARENIIELSNGCVCCKVREDLRATLKQLAESRRNGSLNFDRVVIETTGLADPGPVAQTFFMDERIAEAYTLDSVLTLVDAVHGDEQLNEWQEARRQIGFADRIFMTKAELAEPVALQALCQRLVQMNPRAPQCSVRFGDVPLSEIFDLHGFNLTSTLDIDPTFLSDAPAHVHAADEDFAHDAHGNHGNHGHVDDVNSFVYRTERPFDPSRLERFVGKLIDDHGQALLRYKGVLIMQGAPRKVILQGVHQLMNSDQGPRWASDEVRQSRIVFIGIDMPEQFIRQGLDDCLMQESISQA
jgi:G3E family GTPase